MKSFNDSVSKEGIDRATERWRNGLSRLASNRRYRFEKWTGDLFEKRNPLWQRVGVVKPGKTAPKLTVINTGGARSTCGRVLQQLLATQPSVKKLEFLASR
jgi:hypothetical protein